VFSGSQDAFTNPTNASEERADRERDRTLLQGDLRRTASGYDAVK